MYDILSEALADVLLGVAACLDYRYKKIPAALPVAGILSGIILWLIYRERHVWELSVGILPGAVMILMSFLTNEKVGYGDGLMLVALGLLLSTEKCVVSFGIALTLEAVAGLVLLVLKKVSGKSVIPFLPFLLAGYVAMLGVY